MGAPFVDQVQDSLFTGQSTTVFTTPAQNIVAGSCLVVCFTHAVHAGRLTDVTNSSGDNFVFVGAVDDATSDRGIEMWICRNPAVNASCSVTARGSSMNYWILTCAQYTGVISARDVVNKTGTGTGTAISTASFNTTSAEEYVFCYVESSTGSITAGGNFTIDTSGISLESWHPLTTQTGVAGDATNSVSAIWLAVAASVVIASYVDNFSSYKTVTIDHTQVGGGALINYSVTIGRGVGPQSADSDLKTVGNGGYVQSSSGYDIRPFADSGLTMPLNFELVPGTYDSATGSFEMHVKVPNISASVDTVFYLAFGDAGLTTDASSVRAWNDFYQGVWHSADGSTLSLSDSTFRANNATNHGTTATTGDIDGGLGYNGSSLYQAIPMAGFPSGNAARSVQAWLKPTDVTTNYNSFLGYGNNASNQAFACYTDPTVSGKVAVGGYFNPPSSLSSTPLTINVWNHVAITYDGTTIRYYLNGSADGTATFTAFGGVLATSNIKGFLGCDLDISVFATGVQDETRVTNNVLSAAVIAADYNAQKASSTFLAWGSRIPVGGSSGKPMLYFVQQRQQSA
jgi:hypothetical protein